MQDSDVRTDEFPFARGWFLVCTAADLSQDRPLTLRFFDRKFVAYRKRNGEPVILDAVCVHMGADLGGGTVEDDCIRCPFHHWRFGPDGRCAHIPNAKVIPPKARVRSYPAREINGNIFLWHDPEYGEPDYELPDLEAYHDPAWIKWSVVRRDIRTVPHEIVDNIADRAHFGPVHQSEPLSFEVVFDGHKAIQTQWATHQTLATGSGGKMKTVATYHGPAYLLTHFTATYESWMLVAHTPIDRERVAVWYGLMIKSPDGKITPEFERTAAAYAEAGRNALYQDVDIWENKAPAPTPLLSDADGPIMKAREWYKQFFRPRAAAARATAG